MAAEALTTAALLTAIRSRLSSEIAAAHVVDQMGDPAAAPRKHQSIEVLSVSTEAPPPGDMQRLYTIARRNIRLRWMYSAATGTDSDAAAFGQSVRAALVGDTDWAREYKMLFDGEPIALSRQGGYYIGELEVSSGRGLPVG